MKIVKPMDEEITAEMDLLLIEQAELMREDADRAYCDGVAATITWMLHGGDSPMVQHRGRDRCAAMLKAGKL